MKKALIILLTTFAAIVPISCEDLTLLVDCNNCYESLPDLLNLEIKVSIDSENSYIPVTLYRGNIDNGVVISNDTAYNSVYYTKDVEFGENYSAVAKYSRGGRIIYAVDGRFLKKKLDRSSCSNPCYTVSGDVLDLRLK
jgi:hypothetical protein